MSGDRVASLAALLQEVEVELYGRPAPERETQQYAEALLARGVQYAPREPARDWQCDSWDHKWRCIGEAGHAGAHRDANGTEWP